MHLGDEVFTPFDTSGAAFAVRLAFDRARLTDVVSLVEQNVSSGRVLDLGAAPFIVTATLVAHGYEVTASGMPMHGLETTGVLRLEAGGVERAVRVVLFDAEEPFPLGDKTFDVVIAGELFEHLYRQPWMMLSESWRVLRPGGLLVMTTPNGHRLESLYGWLKRAETGLGFNPDAPSARHAREYSVAELKSVVETQGFDVETLSTRNYPHIGAEGFPGPIGGLKRALYFGLLRRAAAGTGPLSNRGQIIVLTARRATRSPQTPPDFMLYAIGDERTGYNFGARSSDADGRGGSSASGG